MNIDPNDEPFAEWFYPGVATKTRAKPIDLKAGETVTLRNIKLPATPVAARDRARRLATLPLIP